MNSQSLETAFRDAFTHFAGGADPDAFLDFFDDRALFIDDDQTNVLDKPGLRDHLQFHQNGSWESVELIHYEPRIHIAGTSGVVTSYYTLRGKPVNAGFRLRHGVCSISCYFDASQERWRGISLVLGPLMSYIRNASPS